jgi:hypothetical protein
VHEIGSKPCHSIFSRTSRGDHASEELYKKFEFMEAFDEQEAQKEKGGTYQKGKKIIKRFIN